MKGSGSERPTSAAVPAVPPTCTAVQLFCAKVASSAERFLTASCKTNIYAYTHSCSYTDRRDLKIPLQPIGRRTSLSRFVGLQKVLLSVWGYPEACTACVAQLWGGLRGALCAPSCVGPHTFCQPHTSVLLDGLDPRNKRHTIAAPGRGRRIQASSLARVLPPRMLDPGCVLLLQIICANQHLVGPSKIGNSKPGITSGTFEHSCISAIGKRPYTLMFEPFRVAKAVMQDLSFKLPSSRISSI